MLLNWICDISVSNSIAFIPWNAIFIHASDGLVFFVGEISNVKIEMTILWLGFFSIDLWNRFRNVNINSGGCDSLWRQHKRERDMKTRKNKSIWSTFYRFHRAQSDFSRNTNARNSHARWPPSLCFSLFYNFCKIIKCATIKTGWRCFNTRTSSHIQADPSD